MFEPLLINSEQCSSHVLKGRTCESQLPTINDSGLICKSPVNRLADTVQGHMKACIINMRQGNEEQLMKNC